MCYKPGITTLVSGSGHNLQVSEYSNISRLKVKQRQIDFTPFTKLLITALMSGPPSQYLVKSAPYRIQSVREGGVGPEQVWVLLPYFQPIYHSNSDYHYYITVNIFSW